MAENMNALMIEKLNQVYTAEKLALENLPKLVQAATSSLIPSFCAGNFRDEHAGL